MTPWRLRDVTGGDDPFEGRGRRQDDLPRAEQPFGTTEDLGHRVALLRQGVYRSLKLVLGSLVEGAKPQVISNTVLVLEVGGFALGRVDEQDGREVELAAEVIGDPNAHGLVIGQETPMGAQDAELDREAQPVTIGPATEHLGLVGLGERPVPSQLLIGGIFREDDGIAALPRGEDRRTGQDFFSRRH